MSRDVERDQPAGAVQRGTTLRLRVERLVAGGLGLARHRGKVVLVRDAAPGDDLEAIVEKVHRGHLEARATRIVESGPGRREPPCPHAGRCGGCTLQHLAYESQVASKLDILTDALRRVGRVEPPAVIPVHRSPEWGYRRRARFHVEASERGVLVGFRARRGHEVIDIGPCPVLTPPLEEALRELRRRGADGAGLPPEVDVVDAARGILVGDDPPGRIEVCGEEVPVSARAFFQGNAPLLDELVRTVVGFCDPPAPDLTVFDLYAGCGLFARPLARRHSRVVAVESDRRALALLADRTGAGPPFQAEAARVEDFVRLAGTKLEGAVVVVDPPREGLAPAVREALLAHLPRRLTYVSCDPVTLARDIGALIGGGLELVELHLFDLFPQTHHLEAVARLARRP